MTAREHYSVTEAADYLSTTVRFIRRLVADRRVRFYKVGRYVRFKRADLEAYVESGRVEPITAASVRRDLRRAA
ncbi:excisionase family DNA-binding protein [Actinosynnema sp. NPDC020468]|uniref:excisionase family DNA-binding protein n=1 Tax=Actinosynnema sp. NPDC020468 TaxID=3154488 RepID=UPI00340B4BAB